jgi:hypothetical protein
MRFRRTAPGAALFLLVAGGLASATDHNEPNGINVQDPHGVPIPGRTPEPGDIYDLFAWREDDGDGALSDGDKLVVIITFPAPQTGFLRGAARCPTGPALPEIPATDVTREEAMAAAFERDTRALGAYADDVGYEIHLDDLDWQLDKTITVQLGYDCARQAWGAWFRGLPGDEDVVAAVNETVTAPNGTRVRVGLYDEPFFVDLDGFFAALFPPSEGDHRSKAVMGFDPTRDYFRGANVHGIVVEIPVELLDSDDVDVWAASHHLATEQAP